MGIFGLILVIIFFILLFGSGKANDPYQDKPWLERGYENRLDDPLEYARFAAAFHTASGYRTHDSVVYDEEEEDYYDEYH